GCRIVHACGVAPEVASADIRDRERGIRFTWQQGVVAIPLHASNWLGKTKGNGRSRRNVGVRRRDAHEGRGHVQKLECRNARKLLNHSAWPFDGYVGGVRSRAETKCGDGFVLREDQPTAADLTQLSNEVL